MKSLKIPSRVVTIIVTMIFAILTAISTMTPEGLAAYLPAEYAGAAALIIVFAGAIVNQYSEEKRVERAEELIKQKSVVLGYPTEETVMNDEYEIPDDSEIDVSDDGC